MGAARDSSDADAGLLRRLHTPKRVAMLSVHTSPLDQPGTGDAGGMNVYVVELSRCLAEAGTEVEIFTRSTSGDLPAVTELAPGISVRNVPAGPFEGLTKAELPAQLCTFAREVLRVEAAYEPGYYDLIHSHYWLSGQVGALARDRWRVPLVHSMHTMAKVKNAALASGDAAEPAARGIGEEQVVESADLLVANTDAERRQLVDLYGADPRRVRVISPGVDLGIFSPGDRLAARSRLRISPGALVVLFVGRIQPLKAPDLVVEAAARLLADRPELRSRLVVPIVGGPSGSGLDTPQHLAELARRLGVDDVVRFHPPVAQEALVDYYRAATVVCVPSYSESFGLVAIEAQACATPVVAADVGGLSTAVVNGQTGVLVRGHDAADYARVLQRLLMAPAEVARLGAAGAVHASTFGWPRTAEQTLDAYVEAAAPRARGCARGRHVSRPDERAVVLSVVRAALDSAGLTATEPQPGTFLFDLPGECKLATPCRLVVGDHTLAVHAFVCRNPDENHEGVYRWLLNRNLRLYGVAFAVDATGDIYLDGRLSLAAVTSPELDRLLGAVLTYADESFNTLLELGFATSIRREWEWRNRRGESTRNLDAFRGWLEEAEDSRRPRE